ncbi:hypothetical protein HRR83_008405 [Exophiala dermatitidis]|uniref:Uncharacterized protein n=2 Tax=Exophiala dermatitidis TaxID=5970 RepID=H6BKZ2_EXODN|nr:uncharacterized protein HMPREF1120_00020 [Exophiala dermatitidis NIH/UT8656]KAJ4505890.1 hypothetical protein HRR73_008220 [Exophiala dermatitidis]EHY51793.1 hypothetical protein HMPREF1120_00020 [Exophiala dermatitidis NIH/UT8656]KAJ4506524.1 hypothetical protein HRR74_008422 [Exophiala dermatitidis]KAJ4533710.1 hypothetical protein HRR77_008461 [Exophiala dermatitidis]KAJ4547359.1 hypothetical protein HRR76_000009 [Exophiala dermatitidis]
MCESHIIYQLCGHVKVKVIVQCADMIDRLIASHPKGSFSTHQCGSQSDDLHIFPDICDTCKQNGVVAEYIDRPGGKVEVLQAWRKEDQKQSAQEQKSAARDDTNGNESQGSNDADSGETLSIISFSESADESCAETLSPVEPSSVSSVTSSQTSHEAKSSDLSGLKARVAGLTARTDRLLLQIRAHKTTSTRRTNI